jgi:hypothetical protein
VGGLIVACPTSQVQVPEFSIAVKLSMHESVLVIAYFDGDPLPGKGKDNSPVRALSWEVTRNWWVLTTLRPFPI